ncbi:MAG: trypsin-like peptidase domain-containing protein [Acidobacteria bacterium]|nr:trypsin-like peptidase domain-containing protein [Acidobacteriota bacterium]MBI3425902.1 trypsin-like peptidase domain-containing protein [Acidobacteriota bacterium]
MSKLKKSIALLVLFSLPALAQAPKKPSDIAREQGQAVVVIEALDANGNVSGQGSGFIVTAKGAIVTNLHVIQGAHTVRVKLPNGDVYKTQDLVDVDDTKDLALLKIKGFKLPLVALGDSDKTEIGESITVISSPEGLTNSLSTGVVSGVRRLEGLRVFQITAPISQGSSGGAVFDGNGNVIGIVTYLLRGGQNLNFAVPVNYARGMIGDEVTKTLAQLGPLAKTPPPVQAPPQLGAEPPRREEALPNEQLSTAARGLLGRTQLDPLYAQPAQALAFFYRIVDGIGIMRDTELADLTRSAWLIKGKETAMTEDFTINFLSPALGMTLTLNKTDRVLGGVELLVTWTLDDLERVFGNKYTKRPQDAQKLLEFKVKKTEGKKETQKIVAVQEANGLVRSVRFTKVK